MLSTAKPRLFGTQWAAAADGAHLRLPPDASQIGVTAGAASFTDGFPPLTFANRLTAGGVAPSGKDFNGVLQVYSEAMQFMQAGGLAYYDSAFATKIGGYPKGAVLQGQAAPSSRYRSTVDNNLTDPEGMSAANWIDESIFGLNLGTVTSISALRGVLHVAYTKVLVTGYYASGDGGGGLYYYDAADTTSGALFTGAISATTLTVSATASGAVAIGQRVNGSGVAANTYITAGSGTTWTVNNSQTVASTTMTGDDGGLLIVATDGGRWKFAVSGSTTAVTLRTFGAKGDASTDDTVPAKSALATGYNVEVTRGIYKITDSLPLAGSYQKIMARGWSSQLKFVMPTSKPGIVTSNPDGWQRIEGLWLNGDTNCSKVVEVGSPNLKLEDVYVLNATTGGGLVMGTDEDNTPGVDRYVYGLQIDHCLLHGSHTTGSVGVRLGLNSQFASITGGTIIENLETGIAGQRNMDTVNIDHVVFEAILSSGYAIDLRSSASSSTYKAINISNIHFEAVTGGICWGSTGGSGATYTDNVYRNFTFSGTGGAGYVFSILGTCGAGCENNVVEYGDATDSSGLTACTAFFNFNDVDGARSIVSRKGNTAGATNWAVGTAAAYAWRIRQANGYFDGVLVTGGTFGTVDPTRIECKNGTVRVKNEWLPGEYLENIQFSYIAVGASARCTATLYEVQGNTITSRATSGTLSSSGNITINISTFTANPNCHYYVEFVFTSSGGDTNYIYPNQLYFRD